MKDWKEVINPILCILATNVLATIILLVVLSFFPKYIMYLFYRYQCFKLSVKKKKLALSPKFSFSYIERGSISDGAPTVFLIHGFSGSKENFFPLINRLPRTLHIIAVDLLGHGDTSLDENEVYSVTNYVNYLKKFVDLVGLSDKKFHIAGTSLGGHIAGMYSVTHPNDLLSLSMFCPHGLSFKMEHTLQELAETEFFPDTVDGYRKFMHDWFFYRKIDIPSFFLSGMLQLRKEKYGFLKTSSKQLFEEHSLHLLEKNLHKITTPLMIVWGKEDKMLDVQCLEVMKEKLSTPARKIFVVEETGHAIMFERPRKCATFLIEFICS